VQVIEDNENTNNQKEEEEQEQPKQGQVPERKNDNPVNDNIKLKPNNVEPQKKKKKFC